MHDSLSVGPIRTSTRGRIRIVEINRPEVLNAIDEETAILLREAVQRVEADDDIWLTVLRGAGDRAFCAGADLKAMRSGRSGATLEVGGFAGFVRLERSKPVIAAVNGLALGGGFEIAIASDLIVAAEHAEFGLPEVSRGIIAAGGGLVHLGRSLPKQLASELAFTGRRLHAVAARDHGLVNKVVPAAQLMDAALDLAQAVNANAPLAVRASREALASARWGHSSTEAWNATERALAAVRTSEDAGEGPAAFREKRAPVWRAR